MVAELIKIPPVGCSFAELSRIVVCYDLVVKVAVGAIRANEGHAFGVFGFWTRRVTRHVTCYVRP